MAVKAVAFPAALARVPAQAGIVARPSPAQPARLAVLVHADIKEINTDDTVGLDSLLARDFKIVELNEDAFADAEPTVAAAEEVEEEELEAPAPSARVAAAAAAGGPRRSRDAIATGLELFNAGNYAAAVDLFQLALELPGSGAMRMAGSPKEYACASEGEEQAALYNMACAYCRMGKVGPALTVLQALADDTEFEAWATLRSDPDLAPARGPELDKILAKHESPLAKIFGGKKAKQATGEKPWIQCEGEDVRAKGAKTPLGRITQSSVGHNVKKQNETYEFPTTLKLSLDPGRGGRAPSARQIEAAVRAHVGEAQIVYSAYGSPYECSVRNVKVSFLDEEEQEATIKLLGRAQRRRDVPTLGERKEAERQEQGGGTDTLEVSKEDERRWLSGMRVIKSRFGTSKCADCGQTIDPKTKIARGAGATGRGGWVHAACAVAARKRQREEEEGRKKEIGVKGCKKRARKES